MDSVAPCAMGCSTVGLSSGPSAMQTLQERSSLRAWRVQTRCRLTRRFFRSWTDMTMHESQRRMLVETRLRRAESIAAAAAQRKRRPLIRENGRLFIVAADHPARGTIHL